MRVMTNNFNIPLDCKIVKSKFTTSLSNDDKVIFVFEVTIKSAEWDKDELLKDLEFPIEYRWYDCQPIQTCGGTAGEMRLNLMALKEWRRKERFRPTPHDVKVILNDARNYHESNFGSYNKMVEHYAFSNLFIEE